MRGRLLRVGGWGGMLRTGRVRCLRWRVPRREIQLWLAEGLRRKVGEGLRWSLAGLLREGRGDGRRARLRGPGSKG